MVQRRDQGLNHAESSVECARIAPGFEVVRFGDVPIAKFCSLVEMRAHVDGVLDLLAIRFRVKFYFGSKIEVVWRAINRISTKNQQRFHLAAIDIGAKFAQRFQMIHGMRFHRVRVIQRCSHVAECCVDGVH